MCFFKSYSLLFTSFIFTFVVFSGAKSVQLKSWNALYSEGISTG